MTGAASVADSSSLENGVRVGFRYDDFDVLDGDRVVEVTDANAADGYHIAR